MLTRHTNELLLRLERVADVGCAELSGDELRRWYGQERLSKTVWRDIHERWREMDGDANLFVGKSGETYVFVYGGSIKLDRSDNEDAWLEDLADWL
jgi:hypothetical protein